MNSLANLNKGAWEQKIANTSRPCIMVKASDISLVSKSILKGDYERFIDLVSIETHSDTLILSHLIPKIKDFEKQKKLLLSHSRSADNWATIDSLKFNFNKQNSLEYFAFAKEILTDEHTFTRRLGVFIMLKLLKFESLRPKILKTVETLKSESEYYVNMAIAWLISESFIKDKALTIKTLENKNLNEFVFFKSIQKCRDSFRVSKTDKEFLLGLKKKIKKSLFN